MVDLQTGVITLVVVPNPEDGAEPVAVETVTADDEFAPQE
jgi:hypothetical protein